MSKDLVRSTGHVDHFIPIKYCVACKKSSLKVLINLGFVTPFEDSHYILLFPIHLWRTTYTAVLLSKTPSCQPQLSAEWYCNVIIP